jgi:hemoglobin
MFMVVVDDCGVIKMSSRMDGNSPGQRHRGSAQGCDHQRVPDPTATLPRGAGDPTRLASIMGAGFSLAGPSWDASKKPSTLRRQAMTEPTLYERLGGVFAIAAVVDYFSDAVVQNPLVGQKSENPDLREWHTNNLGRLPGLKFMRTLWVCDITGGPQQYVATVSGSTPLGLEEAHRQLKISPAEFDEVAAELARTLDVFKVPEREKGEVLGAFAAHKDEVTRGYTQ